MTTVTGTYLERILEHKRREIHVRFASSDVGELRRVAEARDDQLSLAAALKADGLQVIAEIKRKSPSKGTLRQDLDPVEVAESYAAGGAAAVSVLTDSEFFGGTLEDLRDVCASAAHRGGLVVLQKEFIIDEHQIIEGAAAGADAVLLIVAALDRSQLSDLQSLSSGLGLEALVEVHDESELEIAMASGAGVVGVNNRNLRTFETDLTVSERLLPRVPAECARVAESGIRGPADVERVRTAGADAVLVGEAVMLADDAAAAIRELRGC